METTAPSNGAQLGILQNLSNIMRNMGAIGKDQKNQSQGFMFRGIEQVYNELHPLFAKEGVITLPELLEMRSEVKTTSQGKPVNYSFVKMRYQFISPIDASSVALVVAGEGMDFGDKSMTKSMSVAHKYAMLQMFMIPTADMVDADAESYEATAPVAPVAPVRGSITDEQLASIKSAINEDLIKRGMIQAKFGKPLLELTEEQASKVMVGIARVVLQRQKQDMETTDE